MNSKEYYSKNRKIIRKKQSEKYKKDHPLKSKVCIFCNKKFKTSNNLKIFCSEKCEQTQSRIRNKEKGALNFKKRRQEMKRRCINYMGGKCEICGYNKHLCALDFHHKTPKEKDKEITKLIRNGNWKKIKKELNKCMLLCSNCHRELHFKIYENE